MSVDAGKNIWFTSLAYIIPSALTYLFWFVSAKVGGSQTIGISSSIVALVIILSTVNVFDMSLGMKRSLSLSIARHDKTEFKMVLLSTIIFVTIVNIVSAVLLVIPQLSILKSMGFDIQYLWIIIAMTWGLSYQYVFTEALIAAMRSKELVMPFVIGSLIRFPALLITVNIFNLGAYGVTISYSVLIFLTTCKFALACIGLFKGGLWQPETLFSQIKLILKSGLSSYVPHLLNVIGLQLGILTVTISSGVSEGGKFYISIGIFTISLFIVMSISRVTHSLIPRLNDRIEEVKMLRYLITISFLFTMPLGSIIYFYAPNFLLLLGTDFATATEALQILMMGLPPAIISEVSYYFFYGKGDHRNIFILGLAGNVPRIILYITLPTFFGVNGAAAAYGVGSVIQMLYSIRYGKKYGAILDYKKYVYITIIAFLVGWFCNLISLNPLLGIPSIILLSFFIYIIFDLLTRDDVSNIVNTVLPQRYAVKIEPIVSKLVVKVERLRVNRNFFRQK